MLRERTEALKPDEPLKPNRYWAAVLFEERDPDDVAEQTDYLWLKCNGRTTIKQVKNEYSKRKPGDVDLYLGPTVTVTTDRIFDLDRL